MSQDPNLLEAVRSGDPYLWFARKVGLAPEGATKATHKELRDWLKPFLLGVHYGLWVKGAAARLGVSIDEAGRYLDKHKRLFPVYWAWSENRVHSACEAGVMTSKWGWRMQIPHKANPKSLLNHPIQNSGAHILQFAIIGLIEIAGIRVCCPLHDAVITECDLDKVEEHKAVVGSIMREAALAALGTEIPVDHEVVCFPDRYMDKRPGTREMFDKALEALRLIEERALGEEAENRIVEVGRSGAWRYIKKEREDFSITSPTYHHHPDLPPSPWSAPRWPVEITTPDM
jgi:DNA polymerase I